MTSSHRDDVERCRALAAKEREMAEAETLPRRREQHLISAFSWDQLADRTENAKPGRRAELAAG